MREIIFRGKRVDNGEWVYGIPVETKLNCYEKHVELVKEIEYETEIEFSTYVYSEIVIAETVGQYTGLTDKNGKKVFEGDIVKWDYPCNSEHFYQVKYDGGCACFTTSRIHNSDVIDCIFDNDGNHCEVIGNIHDNPEMMKERDRRSNESN